MRISLPLKRITGNVLGILLVFPCSSIAEGRRKEDIRKKKLLINSAYSKVCHRSLASVLRPTADVCLCSDSYELSNRFEVEIWSYMKAWVQYR